MPNKQDANPTTGRFSYHRSSDGCDDTFLIEDADGQCILQLHFWAEPDTDKAAIAEPKAQMLVAALNLTGGGWVLPPYHPHWTLYHDKQIAAIWGIEDVQELLTEPPPRTSSTHTGYRTTTPMVYVRVIPLPGMSNDR
jgi:hypothetical protein